FNNIMEEYKSGSGSHMNEGKATKQLEDVTKGDKPVNLVEETTKNSKIYYDEKTNRWKDEKGRFVANPNEATKNSKKVVDNGSGVNIKSGVKEDKVEKVGNSGKVVKEGMSEAEVLKGEDIYGSYYEEAKQLFEEDPEFFSNPDKSIIVSGEDLKKARDDYNTLVSQGSLNKGHHKQGLAFGGENINDNITYTGESTIKSSKLENLDLDFYSKNGYGKENAKILKIYKNENGVYVFGNNPRHTAATNFQNKVLRWQRNNGLRK
ncbi:MAG: hypothetical protein N4A64_11100, partial [Marinisporobacter sp.]|nr:hypothetical protein [Marinisporobacter sp.]